MEQISSGDDIYYNQAKHLKNPPQWEGPSKVVATNGKKLFVDKGARLGTVNRDDAVRKGEELWKFSELEKEKKEKEVEESISRVLRNSKPKLSAKKVAAAMSSSESSSSVSSSSDSSASESSSSEEDANQVEIVEEGGGDTSDEGSDDASDDASDATEEIAQEEDEKLWTSPDEIRKDDIIQYVVSESGHTETSLVLQRAAKATGVIRFWWNVQVKETGERKSVNVEAVRDLH